MKQHVCILITIIISPLNGALQLTSPAFINNGIIPEKYTCNGDNVSPQLNWKSVPEKTKTFALIMEDPDAPAKVWVHWILFNISPTTRSLSENTITGPFMNGSTDFEGSQNYNGPCPSHGIHRYQFTLFAIDKELDEIQEGADKPQLLKHIHDHVLDRATLTGRYQSKK